MSGNYANNVNNRIRTGKLNNLQTKVAEPSSILPKGAALTKLSNANNAYRNKFEFFL